MTLPTTGPLKTPSIALLALTLLITASATAQDEAIAPALSIEEIVVQPASPGADTLCQLTVKLANAGDQIASQLGFSVKINGQELGVYSNQLFMFPLPAGESSELRLFNFWTTETSRAMPADGKLRLEVALEEAVWMRIEDDEEGVEVWTPLGEVPNLPAAASVTLEMKKAG